MLGLGSIAKKVFGTANDRQVKALQPIVDKINALEPEIQALSDDALKAKTAEFRKRLEDGESLDSLLNEAGGGDPNAPQEPQVQEVAPAVNIVLPIGLMSFRIRNLRVVVFGAGEEDYEQGFDGIIIERE